MNSEINHGRLEQAFERLQTYVQRDSSLDAHFRALITAEDSNALIRMNAFQLAEKWGVRPRAVLAWMLFASQVGLLDLNWETFCPHCTGMSKTTQRLGTIGHDSECKMCQVSFSIHSDENTEVTFTVNRGIRPVQLTFESFLTYNELFLGSLDATKPITLTLDKPGSYFLMAPSTSGLGGVFRLSVKADYPPLTEANVTFYPESTLPKNMQAGLGKIVITTEGADYLFGMYRDDDMAPPPMNRVTALDMMLLTEFKQIFASDLLSQRESLSVKSLTLMFTDITGSTAMYRRLGDVRAYNLVRDHFEVLFREINQHNGVVVKTIGDAVMAAFSNSDDAVSTALDVQRRIREFNVGRDPEHGVILLKIGLHSGSAIAVNLNNTLDYFGNMVNMAARVQGKSRSEEILMSPAVYLDAPVQKMFAADRSLVIVDSMFELPGLGEQRLYSVIAHAT